VEAQQLMNQYPAFVGGNGVRGFHPETPQKPATLEKPYHGGGVAYIYRQKQN